MIYTNAGFEFTEYGGCFAQCEKHLSLCLETFYRWKLLGRNGVLLRGKNLTHHVFAATVGGGSSGDVNFVCVFVCGSENKYKIGSQLDC